MYSSLWPLHKCWICESDGILLFHNSYWNCYLLCLSSKMLMLSYNYPWKYFQQLNVISQIPIPGQSDGILNLFFLLKSSFNLIWNKFLENISFYIKLYIYLHYIFKRKTNRCFYIVLYICVYIYTYIYIYIWCYLNILNKIYIFDLANILK